MTTNEIVMLAVGLSLGVQTMNLLHAYWNRQDARCGAVRAEATLKRLAGERYLSSFRLYRLGKRDTAVPAPAEPHPAEVLEVSVRDLELKVRAGLGRVEAATRRDGLL
jgi:hypothetical protein